MINKIERSSVRILFILFTLVFSVICGFAVSAKLFRDSEPFILNGSETFTLISLDPEAAFELVWAYSVETKESGRLDMDAYNRVNDLSFKRFVLSGSWDESAEGYPRTKSVGDTLTFKYPFVNRVGYVFCLKSVGGDAIIRHDYPGGHRFYHLKGSDADSAPVSALHETDYTYKYPQYLCAAAVSLILFVIITVLFFHRVPLVNSDVSAVPAPRSDFKTIAAAFLLPVCFGLLLCAAIKITPFGEKTFLHNDMFWQYADFYRYLKSMPAEGNDIFYTFSLLLGENMTGTFAYYLANPLNLILCLVPERLFPEGLTLMFLLRTGLCGAVAAFSLMRMGRSRTASLLFSFAYACGSFMIGYAENPFFIDAVICLPLVCAGLIDLIDGRSCLTYILALAFGIYCNFYFGYMLCIAAVLFFLFRYFTTRRSGFAVLFFRFAAVSVLAAGLTAVMLVPTILSLRNGPKSTNAFYFSLDKISDLSTVVGSYVNHFNIKAEDLNGTPYIYYGIIPLIFALFGFFLPKEKPRTKICRAVLCLLFFASCTLRSLYLAFHAMSLPTVWIYRFVFIFAFFLLEAAADAFDAIPKRAWLTGFSSILIFIDLFLNAYGLLSAKQIHEPFEDPHMTVSEYRARYDSADKSVDWIKRRDSSFYRVTDLTEIGENAGFRNSFNSISGFTSLINKLSQLFLKRLGFTNPFYAVKYGYGSTITADSILGIRYLIGEYSAKSGYYTLFADSTSTPVSKNPYAFSLGFTASPDILGDNFISEDPFEYQSYLLSSISGEDASIFKYASDISITTRNIDITEDSAGMRTYSANGSNPTVTWQINVESSDPLYVYLGAPSRRTVTAYLNGNEIGPYFFQRHYGVIPLGSFEPGTQIEFAIRLDEEELTLFNELFVYENVKELASLRDSIEQAEITRHSSSHFTAAIEAHGSSYLLLTMAYDKGWRFTVNGKRVAQERVFEALTAIPLTEGINTIEARYVPTGFLAGCAISLLSLIIVICYTIYRKETKSDAE